MPVIANYAKVKGYMVIRRGEGARAHSFRVYFYASNCLACLASDFYREDIKDGKKVVVRDHTFWGFWNDQQHLDRCLKDKLYNDESLDGHVSLVKINVFEPEMLKVARAFAKHGFKVQVYYKPYKKVKPKPILSKLLATGTEGIPFSQHGSGTLAPITQEYKLAIEQTTKSLNAIRGLKVRRIDYYEHSAAYTCNYEESEADNICRELASHNINFRKYSGFALQKSFISVAIYIEREKY